jgi:hypothetical protein
MLPSDNFPFFLLALCERELNSGLVKWTAVIRVWHVRKLEPLRENINW